MVCIQKARGSSPLSSTHFSNTCPPCTAVVYSNGRLLVIIGQLGVGELRASLSRLSAASVALSGFPVTGGLRSPPYLAGRAGQGYPGALAGDAVTGENRPDLRLVNGSTPEEPSTGSCLLHVPSGYDPCSALPRPAAAGARAPAGLSGRLPCRCS